MISADTIQRPYFHANRASARPRCCKQAQRALLFSERVHTMFCNAAIARHKATLQNLIDQVINAGLIAMVGCSIAAALAIGAAPMSAGGSQTAMPTSEWRALFDQRVFRASSHEPRMQRLVGIVNAPIGQGWG
jgi:hypothetical protein